MTDLHTAAREALYAKRDTIAQGDYFVRHMSAMTGECLHAKSDIAAELAHRDMEIDRLRAALDAGQAQPVAYMYEQAQWNEGDLRGRGWYPKITRHLEGTENMRRNVVPLYAAPQASQPVAPAGLKLVPVEATLDMLSATMRECGGIGAGSCGEHAGIDYDDLRSVWSEMLSAAPPAPAAQPQPNRFDYLKLIRADFEDRMRAQGENEVALTRLAGRGEYVSPRVQEAWEAEKRKYAAPKQQPLTDAQILAMVKAAPALDTADAEWLHVARAIERAHGIGAQP